MTRPAEMPDADRRRRFSPAERLALFTVAGGRCEAPGCGKPLDRSFHADHHTPFSRGGETSLSNGRALCEACNLKKGSKSSMTLTLRDWQTGCLQAINQTYIGSSNDFLAVACPGAGKTTMALTFAMQGNFDFVIVVCPSTHLKQQWMMAAARMGMKFRSNLNNESLQYGVPGDIAGYCVTYAQVSSFPEVQAAICSKRRVLAILDEIHHAAEERSWGDGLVTSFQNASFRLLLSGTPFRSDNSPIPFVRYDENGQSVENYAYGYAKAVRDGVCRAVVFPHYEGKMEWLDGLDMVSASFADDLDKRGESRRLMTALNTKGMLMKNMLWKAHEKLMAIRSDGEHPDAGGLVVAMNRDHAEQIAATMRKDLKVDPVVVHYDDDQANENIRKFTKSTAPWIIAINMISEGVDIPRLRVGVYATNKMTPMFFQQVIGRLVRMIPTLEEQTAYFYLPKDARLVDMALAIKNEIHHVLMEREEGDREEKGPGEGDGERLPFPFQVIDSDGDEDGHIAGENVFPAEELEHAREIQREHPEFKRIPETSIALLLRKVTGYKPNNPEPVDVPVIEIANPDAENKKLRTKANSLVHAIAYARNPGADSTDFKAIHNHINARLGIVKATLATKTQLITKIDALQETLRQIERA